MGPTGFSPVDSVMAMTGAVWASRLHGAFWGLGVYVTAALIGLIVALWRTTQARGPGPLAAWALLSLGSFVVLGTSPQPLAATPGLAVQLGATVAPTAPTQADPAGASLPTGFLLVNRAMEDATKLVITTVNRDFGTEPLASLFALNHLASSRFDDDPDLQNQLRRFVGGCYIQAAALWRQRHPQAPISRISTPASSELLPIYAEELLNGGGLTCAQDWQAIRARLDARYGTSSPWNQLWALLSRVANRAWSLLSFSPAQSCPYAIGDLRSMTEDQELRNAMLAYAAPGEHVDPLPSGTWNPFSWVSHAAAYVMQRLSNMVQSFIVYQLVWYVSAAAYPFYGFILMLLYAAYPIVLALALLPNQAGRLVTYLTTLFSVKLWPAFWAMINAAHDRVLPLLSCTVQDNRLTWAYPALLESVTAIALLVVPLVSKPSVPHLDQALALAGRSGRQLAAILEAAGVIHLWAMTLFLGILGFLILIVSTVFLHREDPLAPHPERWDRRLTWLAGWSLLAALLSSAASFPAHAAIAGGHAPTHVRIADVVDGIVAAARSGYAEQLNAALALIMAGHVFLRPLELAEDDDIMRLYWFRRRTARRPQTANRVRRPTRGAQGQR